MVRSIIFRSIVVGRSFQGDRSARSLGKRCPAFGSLHLTDVASASQRKERPVRTLPNRCDLEREPQRELPDAGSRAAEAASRGDLAKGGTVNVGRTATEGRLRELGNGSGH